ncbi:hypothetical protein ACFLTZ_01630 [Chloroflexota bacterium]
MKTDDSLDVELSAGRPQDSLSTSFITGPLLGLVYSIVIPFAGLFSVIWLVGCFVKHRLAVAGRRATHAILRA